MHDLGCPFYVLIWPFMTILWSLMAKYRFDWPCIVFFRGHRSKFISSSLNKTRDGLTHKPSCQQFIYEKVSGNKICSKSNKICYKRDKICSWKSFIFSPAMMQNRSPVSNSFTEGVWETITNLSLLKNVKQFVWKKPS